MPDKPQSEGCSLQRNSFLMLPICLTMWLIPDFNASGIGWDEHSSRVVITILTNRTIRSQKKFLRTSGQINRSKLGSLRVQYLGSLTCALPPTMLFALWPLLLRPHCVVWTAAGFCNPDPTWVYGHHHSLRSIVLQAQAPASAQHTGRCFSIHWLSTGIWSTLDSRSTCNNRRCLDRWHCNCNCATESVTL